MHYDKTRKRLYSNRVSSNKTRIKTYTKEINTNELIKVIE